MMSNYYLGIDVSKGYADFIMLDEKKQIVESGFQLDDTFEGHHQLFDLLTKFFKDHQDACVYAAVESTGGYENNWFSTLHKFQETFKLKVARLNPKGVNHNSKAGLDRIITDKIAAKDVAQYLIAHPEKVTYQAVDYYYSLRRKWKFIKSLVKEKTKLFNQLEKMLYEANPDILTYCKDGVGQWVLKLLQDFPTATMLAAASIDTVAQIPYISKTKASKLIERAKVSIAAVTDELAADTIMTIATEILRLENLIDQQIKLITEYCPLPEVTLLKTFTSFGDFSSIGLLIEIGSVERFRSAKQLASFFGLHPVFKTSGDGTRCVQMSKQGRKEPRAILFMVTLTAIRYNPLIKEIYIHNLCKGKSKMDAIGVCMHKILRIVYGILKNKQPFDPEIDRKNREKQLQSKPAIQDDRSRRFQKNDDTAPISRRQNKKRKQKKLIETEHIILNKVKFPPLALN
jgi:transposase